MITATTIPPTTLPAKFPKLMVCTNNAGPQPLIVLMQSVHRSSSSELGVGVVVDPGSSTWKAGDLFNSWSMSEFSDYLGTVTLQNKI